MSIAAPSSVDVERAVLGAALRDVEAVAIAIDILAPEDFYRPAHRHVFCAMQALFEKGEQIDLATVANQLEKSGELKKVGGRANLVDIADSVFTAANVKAHAHIVREKATLRRLMQVGQKVVDACAGASGELDEIIDGIESDVFELARRDSTNSASRVADIVPRSLEIIKQYQAKTGSQFLPTGFAELDEKIMGLRPSDLIIVAARPSMGKTALALNIIDRLATSRGTPVLLFSLEMSKDELVERMICSRAGIDSHLLRKGRLNRHDHERIGLAAEVLQRAPIYVDDSPSLSVLEIRSRARRLQAVHKIGLVVVDYLQLMSGPSHSENRQQEIASISRSLKALAKDLRIPVLALSQLSRQVEMRSGDHRPQLSDLRESGAIEQDADVVLFVYRPHLYDAKADPRAAEVIVSKQRNGPVGNIQLMFSKEFVRFENLAKEATHAQD